MVLNNVQDNSQREPFTGFPPSGSTLCPRCEYDLQGLPLDYQCPECGLAYDRRSKLWREAKTKEAGRLRVGWFSAVSLLTIVGILLYTVYSGQIEWLPSIAMVTTLPTWMVYFMLMIAICVIGAILGAVKIIRQKNKRPILAITPEVIIHSADGTTNRTHIKWDRLHEIEQDVKRHGLTTYQFRITYFHLKSIYIMPFADSLDGGYELLAIVEDHRRKRLGLEPLEK